MALDWLDFGSADLSQTSVDFVDTTQGADSGGLFGFLDGIGSKVGGIADTYLDFKTADWLNDQTQESKKRTSEKVANTRTNQTVQGGPAMKPGGNSLLLIGGGVFLLAALYFVVKK